MIGTQVRSLHHHCFRAGEWATIVRSDTRESDGSPCWLVQFPDGVTDVWVQKDAAVDYEYRHPEATS